MFEEFLMRAGDKAVPNIMSGGAVLQVPAASPQALSKGGGAPAPQQVARVVMLPGAAPNVVTVAPLRVDHPGPGASVAGTTLTTKKAFVFARKHKWMIAAAVLVCIVVIWVLFRMFYKKKNGENSKIALQARRDSYKAFFDEEEGGDEEDEEEEEVRQKLPPSSKASVVQHLLDEPKTPRPSAPQLVKPPKLSRLPPRPSPAQAAGGRQPASTPTVSNDDDGAEALPGTVSAEVKPIGLTMPPTFVPQEGAAAPRVRFVDADALETPLPPAVVAVSSETAPRQQQHATLQPAHAMQHPTLQQAHAMQLRRAAREGAPPLKTPPPPAAAAPVAFDAIIELDDGVDLPSASPPAQGEGARRQQQRLEAGDSTMPIHRAGEQSGKRGGGRAEKELAIPAPDVGGEARGKKGRRTTEEAAKEDEANA
jgi:hypothetical protein